MNNLSFIFAVAFSCQLVRAATNTVGEPFPSFPPIAPAEAENTFKCLDGFQMQLIAAEPLITDPVAIAYDENGRAYVVEMNDYPYTDKSTHKPWADNSTDKPIGKVRILEDTNNDGKFDKSYIFADGLSWPSGITCWKGGVFVTATPDIWYFKDTDGDHKADVRRKVFTGFRKYNVQAVINNPIWGLDNKIYVAGSGNGGKIVPAEKADKEPVSFLRNDFRIDPVAETFEPLSGGARFGNAFDDWGNRFICNIRNPAQHIVLETRYLARNPYLPVHSAVHDVRVPGDTLPVYRISPLEPWRALRAARWSAENKNTPRSELTAGGVFTSASGISVYRGRSYPDEYRNHLFVCEVANNAIHRQTCDPLGVTFKADRADKNAEFVASTDIWFRPVNLANAPDGTLHVLDMYRENIEHPWSIPDDIHAAVDLEAGRERGRIYRLAPPNFKVPRQPRLGSTSTKELVATLENPNAWWRETAHRLIFERQDPKAVGPLRKMLLKSKRPLARLHALWSLEGLDALTAEDIVKALQDTEAGVREHAVKLCESRMASTPALLDALLLRASDQDLRVRFRTAFALGGSNDERVASALYEIARVTPDDPWIRISVCSTTPQMCGLLLKKLLQDRDFSASEGGQKLIYQLAFIAGAENKPDNLEAVLKAYHTTQNFLNPIYDGFLSGLGDGLKQARKNFRTAFTDPQSFSFRQIDQLLAAAQLKAVKAESPLSERVQAIQLLRHETFTNSKHVFEKVLVAREPREIQSAAIQSLSGFSEAAVANLLLQPWRTYTPQIREEVLTVLFSRKDRLIAMLDAIDSGIVSLSQINAARKTQLLTHADASVRDHAARAFGMSTGGSREGVFEKYKPSLSMTGDKVRGEKVYENNCMVCHRSGSKGNELGPNLETVRQWDAEKLLLNILEPNREVAPNFLSYTIDLKDGSSVAGIIQDESASSITVRRADNAQETILRQNIEGIAGSGLSLMPEGLEANMQTKDMADLLAYLTGR
jgi:putative membrane-bound dehydrogenase-like protein